VLLGGAVLLSLLLALVAGAAFGWKERRAAGSREPAAVADAGATEALGTPSKQEQILRDAVEQYLNPASGKSGSGGFGVCADLGLFYLDTGRPDEAGKLFERLEQQEGQRSYRMLGQVGRGIVLALNNEPRRSNAAFVKVFRSPNHERPRPKGGGFKGKMKFPPGPGRGFGGNQIKWEEQLRPIKPLLDNPRWRYWIARARWYNHQNGLPDRDVAQFLKRIPLTEAAE
jgi:hypothetical protein